MSADRKSGDKGRPERSAGGLLGSYFNSNAEGQEPEDAPVRRGPSQSQRASGGRAGSRGEAARRPAPRQPEPQAAGPDGAEPGETPPENAAPSPAEALQRFLDGADRLGVKTNKGFEIPTGHAVALQLIRAHLQQHGGFTAREASMSNMVAAMIDQWHESIFGRTIDG